MPDRRPILALGLALIPLAIACGTVKHSARFDDGFLPAKGTLIEVGVVKNETGRTYDIDIEEMLRTALWEALWNRQLLAQGESTTERYVLSSQIIDYDRGNAAKRWTLPGWGATEISVHCDLARADGGALVGSVDARRTVSVGGAYSIGAWKTIFKRVSKDIVEELSAKFEKQ